MNSNKYEITHKWAMGHPLLSTNSMFFVMSTIWVREHNRVCDILVQKWPEWTDNEIYDTARKIIIGEQMGIMMKEIINDHKYSLDFKPEIYHEQLQDLSSFNTPLELLLTTLIWQSALPDKFNNTSMDSLVFSSNR